MGDLASKGCPDARVLPPEKWAKAVPIGTFRPLKKPVYLRVDADVLAWFQQGGEGYQTRMNSALRFFMEKESDSVPKPAKIVFTMPEHTSRREFIRTASVTTVAAASVPALTSALPLAAQAELSGVQWRNKQPGMAYRRLGKTNLMISEVICGGDPIGTKNYEHLNLAIEMGLNYLDMAPAYGDGDCELGYGKLLGGSAKRDKVFLQTKVSAFNSLRNRMYGDIFKGLPGDKQSAIMQKVTDMRAANIAEKPGYFIEYFPGQGHQFTPSALSSAMSPDYGHMVEGSQEFRKCMTDSVEGSLKRVGTDHFDLLMCPHGADSADQLANPHIYETFQEIRKQGKVRYLGVTSHNDAAATLRKAAELGHYDAVMVAYNVINGGYLDQAVLDASAKDIGIIAMKSAHAVATHHKPLQPIPAWRIAKVDRAIPGDMKAPLKAYIWSLQNPHISAVNSNLWDETYVRENLSVAGKKVQLQPV